MKPRLPTCHLLVWWYDQEDNLERIKYVDEQGVTRRLALENKTEAVLFMREHGMIQKRHLAEFI